MAKLVTALALTVIGWTSGFADKLIPIEIAQGWDEIRFQGADRQLRLDSSGHFLISRNACGSEAQGVLGISLWNPIAALSNRMAASQGSGEYCVVLPDADHAPEGVFELRDQRSVSVDVRIADGKVCSGVADSALVLEWVETMRKVVEQARDQGCRQQSASIEAAVNGGKARFSAICPSGSRPRTAESSLTLWDGPRELRSPQLARSLPDISFQVDCKKNVFAVRNPGANVDQAWQFQADGTFFVTVEGGKAVFRDYPAARQRCEARMAADLYGKIDCSDPARPRVSLDAVYWIGRIEGAPEGELTPCVFPRETYMHARTTLMQCR